MPERLPVGEPVLRCERVDVSYGRVPTLFAIDFEVRANEVVALLGTNGAGKSTLLRAISGVVGIRGGAISFAGRRIDGLPAHQIVEAGIVQVPGGRGAFPGLTIWENLRLAGSTLRRNGDWRADLDRVFAFFPWLADRRRQLAGTLSGGQQQQLLLARAFLARPKVMMIDELSLGLAPVIVEQLLETVVEMNRQGVMIVIVEQNVDLALEFSDRAYFLEKGEVRFSGTGAQLLDRGDLLRSVFLAGAKEAAL